jgi:ribosomal protein L2
MNPIDHPHGGGEGKKSKKVKPLGENLLKKKLVKQKINLIIKKKNE